MNTKWIEKSHWNWTMQNEKRVWQSWWKIQKMSFDLKTKGIMTFAESICLSGSFWTITIRTKMNAFQQDKILRLFQLQCGEIRMTFEQRFLFNLFEWKHPNWGEIQSKRMRSSTRSVKGPRQLRNLSKARLQWALFQRKHCPRWWKEKVCQRSEKIWSPVKS